MRRYLWDFFGPHAEPTARHFLVHLDEFIAREKLEGCVTGVGPDDGDWAVWCEIGEANRSVIERALRPKRYLEP